MLEGAKDMLLREYGIEALEIEDMSGGLSALAYRVRGHGKDFFLKAYDMRRPTARRWYERIEKYMPAVLWLYNHTPLRERITAPILTKTGAYSTRDERYLYMVYPFIRGRTLGQSELTNAQVRALAQLVAELHTYGSIIPAPTECLRERFETPFYDVLKQRAEQPDAFMADMGFAPYEDEIVKALSALRDAEDELRGAELPMALCHGDIHGWNLMDSGGLILIDWEGLMLAPVEADLFSFTEGFFFRDAWRGFLSAYRVIRPEYRVDGRALLYYRLRRRLEDIHEFLDSMLRDSLSPDDMESSRRHLLEECSLLARTMRLPAACMP